MRESPSPSPPPFAFSSSLLGFLLPLGACEREFHNLRELCKNSRDCCGNGGPNHHVSSGIRFVKIVPCVLLVLHEFVFALFFGRLILRFETDLIRFFCVGLIYDVSWVFSPKEFNQFLTRSQIRSNHGLGFENRCSSFPFRFSSDLLDLRRWSSRSSLLTWYWFSLQSFKSFRGVLIIVVNSIPVPAGMAGMPRTGP
jgi:hypothetical protein